jgi:hypothetical protein
MFEYWTHGVGTIVEFPERVALLRHAGWGTLVEQQADPEDRNNNWFHLVLHTPHILAESDSSRRDSGLLPAWAGVFRIVADLNENAVIKHLHIRYGENLLYSEEVDLRGPHVNHLIDAREPHGDGHRWPIVGPDAGLELSVRVEFLDGTPRGQIIFRGASTIYIHVMRTTTPGLP